MYVPPTSLNPLNGGDIPADINQELRDLRDHNDQIDQTNQQMTQQFVALNQGIDNIRTTIAYRSLNACATKRASPLHPLPLPNGGYPLPGAFPATVEDSDNIDGPGLTALL
ncbi:hypothetical protein FRC11_001123 [Ceratobasidium sp. 423]|nr:hypothetical protein FRC11_001123 [Ceratobasidium sp. 423]